MAKLDRFIGHPVLDCNGTKVGTLDDFYRDDHTGRTLWLKVRTGWFGLRSRFVTVEGSRPRGHDIVKQAPVAGPSGPLSDTEDAELTAYYASRLPRPAHREVGGRP